jgi:hypothetical protein
MKNTVYFALVLVFAASCQNQPDKKNTQNAHIESDSSHKATNTYYAPFAASEPAIDGMENDSCWNHAVWDTLDQVWIGSKFSTDDFSGRYKIAWDEKRLYLYIEITDDSILNIHEPLNAYWDDDCVEVFIDENRSGGNHQYNYNAFAYHISPSMDAVDMGTDQKPHLYNSHVQGAIKKNGTQYCWELAIALYPDSYSDDRTDNEPVKLFTGKNVGFSLAYCDNDTSATRENFIGSVNTPGHFNNDGWMNADCFGLLILK